MDEEWVDDTTVVLTSSGGWTGRYQYLSRDLEMESDLLMEYIKEHVPLGTSVRRAGP